ncbi:MAG: general secretion pathway protein GspK [Planctomycetes bacterium]|nr:general secretion pathway protein GspK [Planctomycetota bacterium]MBI3847238.1 general secretion pathway protein GspK [Planctomycetota bacterium]
MKAIVSFVLGVVVASSSGTVRAEAPVEGVRVVFLEPEAESGDRAGALYRLVSDPARVQSLTNWMANESARLAMDLYRRAWRIGHKGEPIEDQPIYYVALVPEGNHADIGFRLKTDAGTEECPKTPYIKLAPQEPAFATTLLHETGHMVLALLNAGDGIATRDLASIPHTTFALTDRGTAFNEGFAIHLETLAAHLASDPTLKDRYHHQRFQFGLPAQIRSEYFRHSSDLLSYSQTRARYDEVRENDFAFAAAFRGPDYLRVQLDKSRDFATLREPDQLLQSEGFYASFFFSIVMRGGDVPDARVAHDRHDEVLASLAAMFRSKPIDADTPYLLRFVESFIEQFPAKSGEVVDVFLDLTHGTFVDARALEMWRDHYLGALRLDLAERANGKIAKARAEWRAKILKDGKIARDLVGPQIRCEVPERTVKLVAFGDASPLVFDVNTAEEGVLRLIPGIADSQVESWLSQRRRAPFADVDDFKKRAGLSEKNFASLKL